MAHAWMKAVLHSSMREAPAPATQASAAAVESPSRTQGVSSLVVAAKCMVRELPYVACGFGCRGVPGSHGDDGGWGVVGERLWRPPQP